VEYLNPARGITVKPIHTEGIVINNFWKSIFWISYPFGVLSFLLPIYGRDIGAFTLEIGGFFSAFSLVPAIIRPFLGKALDRCGRRPFFIIGAILVGLALKESHPRQSNDELCLD